MEIIGLLIKQILAMLVQVLFGFLAIRFGVIQKQHITAFSKVALYVAVPCCLFNAFMTESDAIQLRGIAAALVLAVLIHLLYYVITKLLGRFAHVSAMGQACIFYSNAGNFIVPLIAAVIGREYVVYVVPYLSVQIILSWTHGVQLISGKKDWNIKKVLCNPCIIATALGTVCFLFSWRLPQPLAAAVTSAGDSVGFICMLVTGMLLACANLRDVLCNRKVYMICAWRMLLVPLLIVLLFCLTNAASIMPEMDMVLTVLVITCAAPIASAVVQFAEIYRSEVEFASVTNIASVLFSIVTMPAVVACYQLLSKL